MTESKLARRGVAIALSIAALLVIYAARGRRHEEREPAPRSTDDEEAPKESRGLPVGARCSFDVECASGICYPFAERGPHCSQPCNENKDCPDGSTCSRRNFCK